MRIQAGCRFMKAIRLLILFVFLATTAFCATPSTKSSNLPKFQDNAYTNEQAEQWNKKGKKYKNPFKKGTYKRFLASKTYPKTYDVWKDVKLLDSATAPDLSLVIYLGKQRAVLMIKGRVAMDFPICTGKIQHETPTGEYTILEKDIDHESNKYGNLHNNRGNKIKSNFTIGKEKIPKGITFKGAPMPFFMRLTYGGIGLHVGRVARVPSSHGCIRVPRESCKIVYSKIKEGTPVSIVP